MKVAIVCDWLLGIGGAERVVLELHKLYPEAPIYTSQYDPRAIDWFRDADVRTTWLQHLPKSFKKFLPVLRAWTFSRLNLSEYDLVISSSGAEAKGVKTGPKTLHISYCHAPTHYYWVRYEAYLAHPGIGKLDWLARLGLKLLIGPMRRWDFRAAQKPDFLLANSSHTAQQIQRYYHRDATVIWPPVSWERFTTHDAGKRQGFVTAGRQAPYKRFDLAVKACSELNLPLTVIGSGPEHQKLVTLAGPTVRFVTDADDKQVAELFQAAEAFIFPGMEDFGIVAVEALAAGTPLIAYQAGGSLDFVTDKTGVFFAQQTVESLTQALQQFIDKQFDHATVAATAKQFSSQAFAQHIQDFIKRQRP